MDLARTAAQLDQGLQAKGFKYKAVSASHIIDLRNRIRHDHAVRLIDDSVYELYQDYFEFDPSDWLTSARSIIIVAAPQPKAEIIFNIAGQKLPVIIPPTYHNDTDAVVAEELNRVLVHDGWHVEQVTAPLKLLATYSGLAKYGKNNIAYVDDMGSFFRLAAFATDFPGTVDSWQDVQMLDLCSQCTACLRKCPTGAIAADRFILRAERCLTFHTESPAQFPEWIDHSWYHCLVGCMQCQTCCPLNKDVRSWSRVIAEFSEEETARILQSGPTSEANTDIVALIKRTGLSEDLQALVPRNLRALVERLPAETTISREIAD